MRRSAWLLLALVALQLFLLSAQVPEEGGERGLLPRLLLGVVAPVGVAVEQAGDAVEGVAEGLATRSRALEENRRLRRENLELQRRALRDRALERQVERLRRAVEYSVAWEGPLVVAEVVYLDPASWLQTALLAVETGSARHDQPVVTPDGLLGRVVAVQGRYAKVQLITDRAASVGAMIERTRRQGIVRGAGRGALELHFVPQREDLVVGDRVVTAGIDGVYPRGVPIGVVTSVEPGDGMFHRVEVAPAVDFRRLEQAYVLGIEPVPEDVRGRPAESVP